MKVEIEVSDLATLHQQAELYRYLQEKNEKLEAEVKELRERTGVYAAAPAKE